MPFSLKKNLSIISRNLTNYLHSKLQMKRESKFSFGKTQLQLGTKVEITVSAELIL